NSETAAVLSIDFAGQAGSYALALTNPGGPTSQQFSFTVQPVGSGPIITAISPPSPIVTFLAQIPTINITGSGFASSISVQVFHNELPFSTVNLPSAYTINSNTAAVNLAFQDPGAYGLEVVNPGNLRSNRFNFTVQPAAPAPVISSISQTIPPV